jgi:hypothetical protein
MPELHDAILVTLAVGPAYAAMAAVWMQKFTAAGNAALAVTDKPEAFAGTGVETVAYTREAAHIWHAKRYALRAGLERASTVYFMDSDHRPRGGIPTPKLDRLPPGAGAWSGGLPLAKIRFHRIGALEQGACAAWLDRAAAHMNLGDWRSMRWWGDWLYTVSRDEVERWHEFCPTWDRFADFAGANSSPHPLVSGDGVAMAFAAAACSWTPRSQIMGLLPLRRAFVHLGTGGWRGPGVVGVATS